MNLTPQLSIVIPTRNRRALLLTTLNSLREQRGDADAFEVVVVVDGATDDTPVAVNRLAVTAPWTGRLRCLVQAWAGAAAARNTGLQAARGPLILFLDDDVLAGSDLVAAHLQRHADGPPGGRVVLGQIVPEAGAGALQRQLAAWWREHYHRLAGRPAHWNAFYTGNVSLPRAAALTTGGLDTAIDYGEDVEFGYRLSGLGLPFVYAPEAAVRARNPKSAPAVLRDFARIGEGNVAIFRKAPAALPALPLAAYGETNLRMRLARGLLLRLGTVGPLARAIDGAFTAWAAGRRERRWDRSLFELARAYYFWRGVRAAIRNPDEWRTLTDWGVPILVYHRVHPRPGAAHARYTVHPRRFARQMALLRLLRRRVVPLDRLVATWQSARLPQPRCVALTFDDGYRDNLIYAWPVLRRFGYPATLFLVTGHAGDSSRWDIQLAGGLQPLVTWDEARRLDRAGFRIESHTATHPDLTLVAPAVVDSELGESRRALEQHLGRTAPLFAYPYGHTNAQVEAQVAAAGYRAAFSVRPGMNTLYTGPFHRRRVEIHGDDGFLRFALKVWTGEDPLQYLPAWDRLRDRLPWARGGQS